MYNNSAKKLIASLVEGDDDFNKIYIEIFKMLKKYNYNIIENINKR